MGSDIYTESAVAIRLQDFLNRKELKQKSVRNDIVDELIKTGVMSAVGRHLEMRESVSNFINEFESLISMEDGYEDNRENNDKALRAFCNHTGLDLDNLITFELRSFDNNREVGYDVDIDTIYLMFESHSLFETKMTKSGKELAKTLGLKEITETTWTIHSYQEIMMKDELRKRIEQFIVDYENNIDDVHDNIANMDSFLETAISLLTETVQESGVHYEP